MRAIAIGGASPEPLASYLKALGVLRLVAEQRDPAARAAWRGDVLTLLSSLDEAALLGFFLRDYAPTPLLTPWNGGSGFYPKDNKEGFDALRAAEAPRFSAYREAIAEGVALAGGRPESPKKEDKIKLLQEARRRWQGGALTWLSAAVVITGDDEAAYPALLGTGGNDGRLDFANNQMRRLASLFDMRTGAPKPGAETLLRASLFGDAVPGLIDVAIGQFLPGSVGGPNQTSGIDGQAFVNPWDFVLMLEGAVTFRVAAVRRLDSDALPQASAPFAVRGQAGGYGSAAPSDEDNRRGEQWMPLWSGFATAREVASMFAEGRLQSGRVRAHKAIDAAKAIQRMGAARGVASFVRYGYIERNGQANLAVPLGRWPVHDDPHVGLLDDIDRWVDNLARASRAQGAPVSLGRVVRALQTAMLAVCKDGSQGHDAARWQRLMGLMVDAEDLLISRPKATGQDSWLDPIPPLSPGWEEAADDGSHEFAIARAIASQIGSQQEHDPGPIRVNCVPLSKESGYRRFARNEGGDTLLIDRDLVWNGRDLVSDLGRVAARRVMTARETSSFPLRGRAFAPLSAVSAFLTGSLDDAKISRLARALMALEWYKRRRDEAGGRPRAEDMSALHAIFRIVYSPGEIHLSDVGASFTPSLDSTPLRLLLAGRLPEATEAAIRRLRAKGVTPKLRFAAEGPELARRLAASMAIPVTHADLGVLLKFVTKPIEPNEDSSSANANKETA